MYYKNSIVEKTKFTFFLQYNLKQVNVLFIEC